MKTAIIVLALLWASTVGANALEDNTIEIRGAQPSDHAGGLVAPAGDVNGDGSQDLLLGACADSGHVSGGSPGAVYVIFDRSSGDIDLSKLKKDQGFAITGAAPKDMACTASGLGDINGDGKDDILVGAPSADNNGRASSGSAYVVWGRDDGRHISLREIDIGLGSLGLRIDGGASRDLLGTRVASAGDQNQDGVPDLAIAAPFRSATYVIYGSERILPLDLAIFDLGLQPDLGYRIDTPAPSINKNYSLSNVGDLNDDGTDDLAIGIVSTRRAKGHVYVVFGGPRNSAVNVNELGVEGLVVRGARRKATTGYSLAPIGDFNNDGFGDLAIGAPRAYAVGGRGRVYILLGRKSPMDVDLSSLQQSVEIVSSGSEDRFGYSIAGAGDLDQDGYDDFVVGAPRASRRGVPETGAAYIVWGKKIQTSHTYAGKNSISMLMRGKAGLHKRCATRHSFCPGDAAGRSVASIVEERGTAIVIGVPYSGYRLRGSARVIRYP
ncbi:MAG: hypothetical protein ACR2KQ_11790 [Actinomycetota bacterium]